MQKTLIVLFFAVVTSSTKAQTTLQTLSAAGTSAKMNTITVDYTVGEVVVAVMQSNNVLITSGFQQFQAADITTAITDPVIQKFAFYPNPVRDWLQIDLHLSRPKKLTAEIYTAHGQKVYAKEQSSASGNQQVYLDLKFLVNGTYMLILYSGERIILSRCIIKLK